jgi:hypothetical protein
VALDGTRLQADTHLLRDGNKDNDKICIPAKKPEPEACSGTTVVVLLDFETLFYSCMQALDIRTLYYVSVSTLRTGRPQQNLWGIFIVSD